MDGPRVKVLAGSASPAELAAVVLALEAAARETADAAPPAMPPWLRASLVEGVGRPRVTATWELPPRAWGSR
ncbi:MAG TPA: hypothetical protein VIK95_05395 [Egibacteraceae bacterium]